MFIVYMITSQLEKASLLSSGFFHLISVGYLVLLVVTLVVSLPYYNNKANLIELMILVITFSYVVNYLL
jgi:hypothetical protein